MRSSTSSSEFLAWGGVFLGLTLGVFAGLERYAAAASPNVATGKYEVVFDQGGPAYDTLLLGSSHCNRGIRPDLLEATGLKAFNYGYNAGNPAFFERWYATYRRYQGAPRQVIYAVDWFMFTDAVNRRFEQDAEWFPLGFWLGAMLEPGLDRGLLVENRFAFVKHQRLLQSRLFGETGGAAPPGPAALRGWNPAWSVQPDVDWEARKKRPQHLPTQVEAFDRLLDRLAADGARVLLIEIPEYVPAMGEHPAEQGRLAAIARQHGLPFWNYNVERRGPLSLEQRWYENAGHLKLEGAVRFSHRLAHDLAAERPFKAKPPG